MLTDMKMTYVIYLTDVCPDTGFVSQMKPVAYTEIENMAQFITDCLNKEDCDDPNRTYRYQPL
jgi:hypothetical protein